MSPETTRVSLESTVEIKPYSFVVVRNNFKKIVFNANQKREKNKQTKKVVFSKNEKEKKNMN